MKKIVWFKICLSICCITLIVAAFFITYGILNKIPVGRLRIVDEKGNELSVYNSDDASFECEDKYLMDYTENAVSEGYEILSERYHNLSKEKLLNSALSRVSFYLIRQQRRAFFTVT